MTLREIAEELKNRGHKVEYRQRSDGGIFITRINGVPYQGAEGNKVARTLVGAKLSERRARQLEYATKQQKAYKKAGYTAKAQRVKQPRGRRRTDAELTQEELLKRQLQRTQKAWRSTKSTGVITAKKARYLVEKEGYDVAIGQLKRLERYAKGYAYKESIDSLVEEFKTFLITAEGEDKEAIEEIIDLIESKRDVFKEQWVQDILMFAYNYRNKEISIQQLYVLIKFIVK